MIDFNEHNYLCHYGIKGMKWGMRRYQNPDGSLTPAGKARYGGGKAEEYRVKLLRKANKMNKHGEYENAIKKIKSVSNEELAQELANRDKKAKRTGGYSAAGAGAVAFIGNIAQVKAADDNGVTIAQTTNVPLTMLVSYFAGKGTSKLSYSKNLINKYNETPVPKTAAEKEKHSAFYSKTEQKQIKKEHKENVHIEEKRLSAKYEAREKEIREEIDRLAKKYDFDLDDGGGGKTKEDEKAGARYMLLWEEIDDLDRQRRNEAIDVSLKKIEDKYGKSGTVYAKKARV